MRYLFAAAALMLVAGSAHASDALPVKHGFYVTKGTACANASNATIMRYVGTLTAGPPEAACKPDVITHKGAVYTLTRRCGSSTDVVEYTVESRTAFTMKNFAGTFSYRLCPHRELPQPWRSVPTP